MQRGGSATRTLKDLPAHPRSEPTHEAHTWPDHNRLFPEIETTCALIVAESCPVQPASESLHVGVRVGEHETLVKADEI